MRSPAVARHNIPVTSSLGMLIPRCKVSNRELEQVAGNHTGLPC